MVNQCVDGGPVWSLGGGQEVVRFREVVRELERSLSEREVKERGTGSEGR